MNPDYETVLERMRRELRANSGFRKLPPADQEWLVERLAIGDFGTLAQLSSALESRCQVRLGTTPLHNLRQLVQSRLSKMEGMRETQRTIVDRLTAGATVAADIERIAQSALPRLTKALAGLLGDKALNLVAKGGDPEETRKTLADFLEAASSARADDELEMAKVKFAEGLRTKVDAGLNALFIEIQGNAEAEALFARLKAIVAKELA